MVWIFPIQSLCSQTLAYQWGNSHTLPLTLRLDVSAVSLGPSVCLGIPWGCWSKGQSTVQSEPAFAGTRFTDVKKLDWWQWSLEIRLLDWTLRARRPGVWFVSGSHLALLFTYLWLGHQIEKNVLSFTLWPLKSPDFSPMEWLRVKAT